MSVDLDASLAVLDRTRMGNRLRAMRKTFGMSQTQFSRAFGIPLANLRQYELARHMPPPAVRAYLQVIEEEPDMVQRVIARRPAI